MTLNVVQEKRSVQFPQRQPQIDIERFNVVEDFDSREYLSINEDAVTFRIIDSLSLYIHVYMIL